MRRQEEEEEKRGASSVSGKNGFFSCARFPSLPIFSIGKSIFFSPPVAVDIQKAHGLVRGPGRRQKGLEVLLLDVGA